MYASMAALNAAKPPQPRAAACGPVTSYVISVGVLDYQRIERVDSPALYAKAPPVIHPAATLLVRSDFARNPSIQHSVPEYIVPINAKFFAEL